MPFAIDYSSPVNRASPHARGLVGFWLALPGRMSGFRLLDLCNVNHAAILGGPAWSGAIGRPGGFGSIKLTGSPQYISATMPELTRPLTMGAWVYFTTAVTTQQCIVSHDANTGTGYRLCVGRTSAVVDYVSNAVAAVSFSTLGVATGKWLFTAASDNGTNAVGYVGDSQGNFKSESLTSPTVANAGANAFRMGSLANNNSNPLGGYIDSSFLYRRALSSGEVFALYNESRRGYPNLLNFVEPARPFAASAGGGGATAFPWHYYQQMMAG